MNISTLFIIVLSQRGVIQVCVNLRGIFFFFFSFFFFFFFLFLRSRPLGVSKICEHLTGSTSQGPVIIYDLGVEQGQK